MYGIFSVGPSMWDMLLTGVTGHLQLQGDCSLGQAASPALVFSWQVSLCSPSWPRTCYVDYAALKLTEICPLLWLTSSLCGWCQDSSVTLTCGISTYSALIIQLNPLHVVSP